MGFVGFGLITLGVPLLLMALPSLLLIFARGMRFRVKALWVLSTVLLVVGTVILLPHSFPKVFFWCPPWVVYFAYLWFGRSVSLAVGQKAPRVSLMLVTAVFLGLVGWSGATAFAWMSDHESTHDVLWPLDGEGANYLHLHLPAHFSGNWLPPVTVANASVPGGTPDRQGEISAGLLWPTLETRTYRNEAEFEGFAPHVVSVDFKVLNRISADGRSINQLACNFEQATHELGKDCLAVLPKPDAPPPLETLAPRYGLARRGSEAAIEQKGVSTQQQDVWFALADDGNLETVIECPREDVGSTYATCKQSFEVRPFNAVVEARYNRSYLPQWRDIQVALTKILVAMRS